MIRLWGKLYEFPCRLIWVSVGGPVSELPSPSASMSRLCCSDSELFARWSKVKLQTDLCLKPDKNSTGFPVSLHAVQLYSDQLADLIQVALEHGNKELVVHGAPPKALELFVHAMYGRSLKETVSPAVNERYNIRDLKDIVLFGHKYNITQIEAAVCEIITSHLDELCDFEDEDVFDFYNSMPSGCSAAQDAVFRVMLGFQERHGSDIMGAGVTLTPRHVNQMLPQYGPDPKLMLGILERFVQKQDVGKFPWDFKVIVPHPSDFASLSFQQEDVEEAREFATGLKPGNFKQGVDDWIFELQKLMCKHFSTERKRVARERNVYKQHIQAQFPSKRIKIQAGQLVIH